MFFVGKIYNFVNERSIGYINMLKRYIMKQAILKIFTILCMVMTAALGASAVELQEVVYLKNGSVIRGVILEMVPEKSVKIQTSDGNIFVYQMSEVQKITKEESFKRKGSGTYTDRRYDYNYDNGCGQPRNYRYTYGRDDRQNCRDNNDYEPYGWERAPRYRGFVGFSGVIGVGDYDFGRVMLFTSHGVQVTPEIFVGAGIGITGWWEYDDGDIWDDTTNYTSIPIFANFRGELHNVFRKNFSPYLDIKLGYNTVDLCGVFFAPEIGCHFYFGHKKFGLGFGIGYHLQSAEVAEYWYDYSHRNPVERWSTSREILNGVAISVAFDF